MSCAAEKFEEEETKRPSFLRKLPWGGFSYKDYLKWDEDVRWELMNGIPYMMAGASVWHQRMVSRLHLQLGNLLTGKPCEVFIAPFDVRLFPKDDLSDITVVQPDVLVVCDEEKISDGKACKGPPDFIAEVVSENSEGRDLIDKRKLYEKAGVKEYWAVTEKKVHRYILKDNKYEEDVSDRGQKLPVSVLKGCFIDL